MKGESPLPSDGLGRLLEGFLAVSRLMRHGLVIMECFQRLVWVFGCLGVWARLGLETVRAVRV